MFANKHFSDQEWPYLKTKSEWTKNYTAEHSVKSKNAFSLEVETLCDNAFND